MAKGFRTITRYECEASGTSAELRSNTIAVLNKFDDEDMTRQQLVAAVEMLQEVISHMEDAPTEDDDDGEGHDD